MKAEEARKIADNALAELNNALSRGKSEQLVKYLGMLARFHRYSFGNVLLILSQKSDATHVAGFHTWKQLGRFVKKGEKGIVILAPIVIRPKTDGITEETGEGEKRILRFRAVYVFDVSQTDGQELPLPAQVCGDPAEHLVSLRALVAEKGISLDYDDLPAGADGVSRGGRISIRPGLEPANEFSVMVHELAHELLHRGDERPVSKTVRETEAEAVAFVVCRAVGLDTGTAASDYIQLYDGKPETLAASLEKIQNIAAEIIRGIMGTKMSEPGSTYFTMEPRSSNFSKTVCSFHLRLGMNPPLPVVAPVNRTNVTCALSARSSGGSSFSRMMA